jgi:PDZ domain
MHFQTSTNRNWSQALIAPAALFALGLILSLPLQARSEDKKEPTAQESLKQRLKKYEDEAAKLRETMLKECDDEIKKADEAIKKAQKDRTDTKKDAEAHGKAIQALQKAQSEKTKLQLVRAEVEKRILYGVVAPTPVKPPKPKKSELQKLGILPLAPGMVLVKQLGLEKDQGLVLELVQPNHAAAKAGLQAYDVLVQMDGKPVPSSGTAFRKLLTAIKTDTPFDVVVVRGGKKETIKGVVIPGDNDDPPKSEPKKPAEEPKKPPTDPKKATEKTDPKKPTDKPKIDPKKPTDKPDPEKKPGQ